METLALKLVLTPLVIGAASLSGRRWGESVGGWLIALPFTSAPIIFFLSLEHGASFAAAAASGSLAGGIAQAVFCLAYARVATASRWPAALFAGAIGFAIATTALRYATVGLGVLFVTAIGAIALALRLMPAYVHARAVAVLPRWDIPARMILATLFVLALTAAAPVIGPRLTGLLATFPIFTAIMTGFAHHLQGAAAGTQVLRGLLLGLFAFAGFFVTLGGLLERLGTAAAFAVAIAVALAVQAMSLWAMRRQARVRARIAP